MKSARVLLLFTMFFMPGSRAQSQDPIQSYESLISDIQAAVKTHSQIARIETIGKTEQGREIHAVTLSAGDHSQKPALLIVAGIEATHLAGVQFAARFVLNTLEQYDKTDSIKQLLDRATIYIVVNANPDARKAGLTKPVAERNATLVPFDDDNDGHLDEDPPDDLNLDGLITSMRIKTPGGTWRPSKFDPRVLVPAVPDKGDKGVYELMSEGLDNDGDGQINEDAPGGVNPNRNFSFGYRFFSTESGAHPMIAKESRTLADFCIAQENIAVVLVFSSQDNLVSPWEHDKKDDDRAVKTSVDEKDAPYYKFIGDKYRDVTKFSDKPATKTGTGSFVDWAYFHFGRWALASKGWEVPQVRDTSKTDDKKKEQEADVKALFWLESAGVDAFVDWKPVQHPDYPDKIVEVGGFRPFALASPPVASLDTLSAKHHRFLYYLASLLPRADLENLKVEKLSGDLFRISADLVNTGYFPTNSAHGSKSGLCRNIRVALELKDGQTVVQGKRVTLTDPIAGSGGAFKLAWVVSAKSGTRLKLDVNGPTIINISREVDLK